MMLMDFFTFSDLADDEDRYRWNAPEMTGFSLIRGRFPAVRSDSCIGPSARSPLIPGTQVLIQCRETQPLVQSEHP